MTMRMLGVLGELTGPVIELGERDFTMDVEGEEFRAKVSCPPDLLAALSPGELVFVVGRIHFREFDAGRLLVDAQRVVVRHRGRCASGAHSRRGRRRPDRRSHSRRAWHAHPG